VDFDSRGRQKRSYVYGKTRAEAATRLDQKRKDFFEGKPLSVPKETLANFLKRWLTFKMDSKAISPKSQRTYNDLINKHIVSALGHINIQRLAPDHVQRFVALKTEAGLSPKTVKHCRDCLRAALNEAMRSGLVNRNAPAQVRPPKQLRRPPQVFNKAQARAFLDAIRGHRLESLFLVALCMGMREGEVLGLSKADVDLENKRLHIRHSLQRIDGKLMLVPTKTEESQRSPILPDVVVSSLGAHFSRQDDERMMAGSDWVETGMVFTTGKGTLLDARNVLREYYKIRDTAGLPSIRFHDLRHSAASLLHASGVPLVAIQKLLGHASFRPTQEVYAHITSDLETEAASTMDELLAPPATLSHQPRRGKRLN